MRILELYSGTGSVSKVCKERGWDVVSVDIDGRADITIDMLKWDYKKDFKIGDFDIIFASPPCDTFSSMRRSWINRKLKAFGDNIVTAEMLDNDMIQNGLPLVRKTEEIIEYFKPKYFFIENPATGRMKNYLTHLKHHDVTYCSYSDWGYKKPTRIWCSNHFNFEPKYCDGKTCPNMINGKHKVSVCLQFNGGGNKKTLDMKYRIPPLLINELFDSCEL